MNMFSKTGSVNKLFFDTINEFNWFPPEDQDGELILPDHVFENKTGLFVEEINDSQTHSLDWQGENVAPTYREKTKDEKAVKEADLFVVSEMTDTLLEIRKHELGNTRSRRSTLAKELIFYKELCDYTQGKGNNRKVLGTKPVRPE